MQERRDKRPWRSPPARTAPAGCAFSASRILDTLQHKVPKSYQHLDAARDEVLAFTVFQKELWKQIWSNNPNERLNRSRQPYVSG